MRDLRLEVKSLDHRELFEPQVAALTRDFSKPSISPRAPSEGRAGPSSRTTDQVKPQVAEGTGRPLFIRTQPGGQWG